MVLVIDWRVEPVRLSITVFYDSHLGRKVSAGLGREQLHSVVCRVCAHTVIVIWNREPLGTARPLVVIRFDFQ